MSVHYKFKSSLDYDTVTFDGLHISVGDLKKSILQQKKIGKGFDFDLQITNAQTKEVYVEDGTLIPKNASVIVSRVPNSLASKKSWERNDTANQLAAVGNDSSDPFDKATKAADLVSMNVSENDKILAMMSQSTQDYDPSRYFKMKGMTGPLPSNYTCFRCGRAGHWIKNCPTNSVSGEPEPNKIDVKRSTGIPRSFMVTVEGPKVPGALLTSTGHFAVPMIDHEAYREGKKERPPFSKEMSPEKEPAMDIPEELQCMLCRDLLSDAVLIPCCGNSYCDECVRQVLLDSDDHECPTCHEKDISPDTLIPIRHLRNSVLKFKNQTGYTKSKKRVPPPVPNSTTEPEPGPSVQQQSESPQDVTVPGPSVQQQSESSQEVTVSLPDESNTSAVVKSPPRSPLVETVAVAVEEVIAENEPSPLSQPADSNKGDEPDAASPKRVSPEPAPAESAVAPPSSDKAPVRSESPKLAAKPASPIASEVTIVPSSADRRSPDQSTKPPNSDTTRAPPPDGSKEPGRETARNQSRDPVRHQGRDAPRHQGRDLARHQGHDMVRHHGHDVGRYPDLNRPPGHDLSRHPFPDLTRPPGHDLGRYPVHDMSRHPPGHLQYNAGNNRESESDSRAPFRPDNSRRPVLHFPETDDDRKSYTGPPPSLLEHPGTPVRDEYGIVEFPSEGGRYPNNYRDDYQYHDDYPPKEAPRAAETFTIQTIMTTREWQPEEMSQGSFQQPRPSAAVDSNAQQPQPLQHQTQHQHPVQHPHHLPQQQHHISRADNTQTSHLMPIDVSNITGTPVPVVSQSPRDEHTQISIAYSSRPSGTHPVTGAPPGTYSAVLPLSGKPPTTAAPPHLMSMPTSGFPHDVRHPPPHVVPAHFHGPPPTLNAPVLRRPPMLPPPGPNPLGAVPGQPLPPGIRPPVVPPPPITSVHSLPPPPGDPYHQLHPHPPGPNQFPPHSDTAYLYGSRGYGERPSRDPLDAFARELFEYQREGRRARRRSSSSSRSNSSRSRSYSSRSRSNSSRSYSRSRSRSKSYSRSRSRSQFSRRSISRSRSPRSRSPRSRSPKHSAHKRSPSPHKRRPAVTPPPLMARRHTDFLPSSGAYYGGNSMYRSGATVPPPPGVPPANSAYETQRGRYDNRYDVYHQYEHHAGGDAQATAAAHHYDMRDPRYNRGGSSSGNYMRYDDYYRGGGAQHQRHMPHHASRTWESSTSSTQPTNLMAIRARPHRDIGRRGGRGGSLLGSEPGMMKPQIPGMDKPPLMSSSRERIPGRGQDYGGPNREYMGSSRGNQNYMGPSRGGGNDQAYGGGPHRNQEYGTHRSQEYGSHRGQEYGNPSRSQEYVGRGSEYGSSSRGHHEFGDAAVASSALRNVEYSRSHDYGGSSEQRGSGSSSRNQDYGSSSRSGDYISSSRGGPEKTQKPSHRDEINGGTERREKDLSTKEISKDSRTASKEARSSRNKRSGKPDEEPRSSVGITTTTGSKTSGPSSSKQEKVSRSSSVEKSRSKKHKSHHVKEEPTSKKLKTSKRSGGESEGTALPATNSSEADTRGSSSKKSARKKRKRSKDDDGASSDVAAPGKSRSSPKASRRQKGVDVNPSKEEKRSASKEEKTTTASERHGVRNAVVKETSGTESATAREALVETETSPTAVAEADDVPVDHDESGTPEGGEVDDSKVEPDEEYHSTNSRPQSAGSEPPEDDGDGIAESETADVETDGEDQPRDEELDEAMEEDEEDVLMAPVPELSKWEIEDVESGRPDESTYASQQQQRYRNQSGTNKKSLPADIVQRAEKAILHKAMKAIPVSETGTKVPSSNRKTPPGGGGGSSSADALDDQPVSSEKEPQSPNRADETGHSPESNVVKESTGDRVKLDRSKFTDKLSPNNNDDDDTKDGDSSSQKKEGSLDEVSADEDDELEKPERKHKGSGGEKEQRYRDQKDQAHHHHRGRDHAERHSDRTLEEERSGGGRHHRRHNSRDRDRSSYGPTRRDERDRPSTRRDSRERTDTRSDDHDRYARNDSRDRSGARHDSRDRSGARHDSRDRAETRRGGSRDRNEPRRGSRDRSNIKVEVGERVSARHDSRERPTIKIEERSVPRQDDRRRDYSKRNPSPPESREQGGKEVSRTATTNRVTISPKREREERMDKPARKVVEEERSDPRRDKGERAVRVKRASDSDEDSRGGRSTREEVDRRESAKTKVSGSGAPKVKEDSDTDLKSKRRRDRRLSSIIDESKFEPNYDEGGGDSDRESVSKKPPKPIPVSTSPTPVAAAVAKVAPPSALPAPKESAAPVSKRKRSSSTTASSSSSPSEDESSSPRKKSSKELQSKHGKRKKSKKKKSKKKKSKKKKNKKNKVKEEEKPVKSVVKH